MDGQRPVGDRGVLQRAPHQRRRHDGAAVVREAHSALVRELGHLGELGAGLALGDGGEEADRDLRVGPGLLGERAEDRGRVDDRLRVRHREDRAVAAGRSRLGAARDRLLVLASRSPEVHVRIDEGRRQHEPGPVEHAVPVDGQARAQLGDRAAVDLHVELRVDALGRVEDAGTADDEALLRRVLHEELRHHATSTGSSALTAAGPVVSRS